MALKNPFTAAVPVSRKIKLLLFGDWGTGKTLAALSFPRVAIIDSEGGSTFFAGRPDIKPFARLATKSMADLEAAIAFIAEDNGKTFDTLVIDPISVIYKVTREAIAAANKKNPGEMGYREWGKLNSRMNSLYTRLINLPVHVVMIARQSPEYEGTGDSLRRIGDKPDSDRDIGYLFDAVLQMQEDFSGLVIKSRPMQLRKGQTIKTVNWSVFEPIVSDQTTTRHEALPEDDAAIASEATRENHRDEFQSREAVEAFVSEWKAQGATVKDITSALKVDKLSQWMLGLEAARKAMREYLGLKTPAEKADDVEATKEAAFDALDIPPVDTLAS